MSPEIQKIIDDAKWAVDAFDQANTSNTIVKLGSRGLIAAKAVHDLRVALREAGYPSLLPKEPEPKEE